jgi:hypothetical protein
VVQNVYTGSPDDPSAALGCGSATHGKVAATRGALSASRGPGSASCRSGSAPPDPAPRRTAPAPRLSERLPRHPELKPRVRTPVAESRSWMGRSWREIRDPRICLRTTRSWLMPSGSPLHDAERDGWDADPGPRVTELAPRGADLAPGVAEPAPRVRILLRKARSWIRESWSWIRAARKQIREHGRRPAPAWQLRWVYRICATSFDFPELIPGQPHLSLRTLALFSWDEAEDVEHE